MKSKHTALTAFLVLLIGSSLAYRPGQHSIRQPGQFRLSIVVSVEARHGEDRPVLNREM